MGRQRKEPDSPDTQVRELVLRSAARLFDRKGYAATTVREIVAAAGVSKPVLYYYFGSKEGIYLELMQGPVRKFDAVFGEIKEKKGSASDKLQELMSRTFVEFLEHMEAVRIMYSLYYGPHQGAPFFDFATYHERYWETVHELVDEGCERGEFKKVAPDLATWAVLGPLAVAVQACLSYHEGDAIAENLSRVLKIVLDGMKAVPSEGETC
jgi:TetR/AcrR family transcriptional regulator